MIWFMKLSGYQSRSSVLALLTALSRGVEIVKKQTTSLRDALILAYEEKEESEEELRDRIAQLEDRIEELENQIE